MQMCMTTFFDLSAFLNNVTLVITALLLLKKIADMDRYHTLRVVILTSVFSCLIVYMLFVTMGANEPYQYDYVEFDNNSVSTMTR
jgi:uncharacterized MnhB-related membrane protein